MIKNFFRKLGKKEQPNQFFKKIDFGFLHFRRFVGTFLIITLTLGQILSPDIAQAWPSALSTENLFQQVYFPDFVRVKWFQPLVSSEDSKGVVYLIQDAHTSLHAQQNITQLLQNLYRQKQLNEVLVEGAAGKLTENRFKNRRHLQKNPEFLERLERLGYLHGGAAFYLNQSDVLEQGLETPELYRHNLELFQEAFRYQKDADRWVEELRAIWRKQVMKSVPAADQKFFLKYGSQSSAFQDTTYFRDLIRIATDRLSIRWSLQDQTKWPNLIRLQRIFELTPKLKHQDVLDAIRLLKKVLPAASDARLERIRVLIELEQKGLSVQVNASELRAAGAEWIRALRGKQLGILPFHALWDWLALATLQAEVNPEALLVEAEKIENQIWSSVELPGNAGGRDLGRFIGLLEKASKLQLSRAEVRRFRELAQVVEVNNQNVVQTAKLDFDAASFYKAIFDYYAAAEKRETGFREKISERLQFLRSHSEINFPRLAIVVGGYHKDGLLNDLIKKGLSVAVITPHLREPDEDVKYLGRMLEKDSNASTLAVAPAAAISPAELILLVGPGRAKKIERELSALGLSAESSEQPNFKNRTPSPNSGVWKRLILSVLSFFLSFWIQAQDLIQDGLSRLNAAASALPQAQIAGTSSRTHEWVSTNQIQFDHESAWGEQIQIQGQTLEELIRKNPANRKAEIAALLQEQLRRRYVTLGLDVTTPRSNTKVIDFWNPASAPLVILRSAVEALEGVLARKPQRAADQSYRQRLQTELRAQLVRLESQAYLLIIELQQLKAEMSANIRARDLLKEYLKQAGERERAGLEPSGTVLDLERRVKETEIKINDETRRIGTTQSALIDLFGLSADTDLTSLISKTSVPAVAGEFDTAEKRQNFSELVLSRLTTHFGIQEAASLAESARLDAKSERRRGWVTFSLRVRGNEPQASIKGRTPAQKIAGLSADLKQAELEEFQSQVILQVRENLNQLWKSLDELSVTSGLLLRYQDQIRTDLPFRHPVSSDFRKLSSEIQFLSERRIELLAKISGILIGFVENGLLEPGQIPSWSAGWISPHVHISNRSELRRFSGASLKKTVIMAGLFGIFAWPNLLLAAQWSRGQADIEEIAVADSNPLRRGKATQYLHDNADANYFSSLKQVVLNSPQDSASEVVRTLQEKGALGNLLDLAKGLEGLSDPRNLAVRLQILEAVSDLAAQGIEKPDTPLFQLRDQTFSDPALGRIAEEYFLAIIDHEPTSLAALGILNGYWTPDQLVKIRIQLGTSLSPKLIAAIEGAYIQATFLETVRGQSITASASKVGRDSEVELLHLQDFQGNVDLSSRWMSYDQSFAVSPFAANLESVEIVHPEVGKRIRLNLEKIRAAAHSETNGFRLAKLPFGNPEKFADFSEWSERAQKEFIHKQLKEKQFSELIRILRHEQKNPILRDFLIQQVLDDSLAARIYLADYFSKSEPSVRKAILEIQSRGGANLAGHMIKDLVDYQKNPGGSGVHLPGIAVQIIYRDALAAIADAGAPDQRAYIYSVLAQKLIGHPVYLSYLLNQTAALNPSNLPWLPNHRQDFNLGILVALRAEGLGFGVDTALRLNRLGDAFDPEYTPGNEARVWQFLRDESDVLNPKRVRFLSSSKSISERLAGRPDLGSQDELDKTIAPVETAARDFDGQVFFRPSIKRAYVFQKLRYVLIGLFFILVVLQIYYRIWPWSVQWSKRKVEKSLRVWNPNAKPVSDILDEMFFDPKIPGKGPRYKLDEVDRLMNAPSPGDAETVAPTNWLELLRQNSLSAEDVARIKNKVRELLVSPDFKYTRRLSASPGQYLYSDIIDRWWMFHDFSFLTAQLLYQSYVAEGLPSDSPEALLRRRDIEHFLDYADLAVSFIDTYDAASFFTSLGNHHVTKLFSNDPNHRLAVRVNRFLYKGANFFRWVTLIDRRKARDAKLHEERLGSALLLANRLAGEDIYPLSAAVGAGQALLKFYEKEVHFDSMPGGAFNMTASRTKGRLLGTVAGVSLVSWLSHATPAQTDLYKRDSAKHKIQRFRDVLSDEFGVPASRSELRHSGTQPQNRFLKWIAQFFPGEKTAAVRKSPRPSDFKPIVNPVEEQTRKVLAAYRRGELKVGLNPETGLKVIARGVMGYLYQLGLAERVHDQDSRLESLKIEEVDASRLPHPDGPVIAVISAEIDALATIPLIEEGASIKANFVIVPPVNGLFYGPERGDAVFVRDAVFFDADKKLVLGKFKTPIRIHAAVISAVAPTETLRELEKRGIPTLDSSAALELVDDKIKTGNILESLGVPTPEFEVLQSSATIEEIHETVTRFREKILKQSAPGEIGAGDIVVKPFNGSQGTGVTIYTSKSFDRFPNIHLRKYSLPDFRISQLLKAGEPVLIQRRIANPFFPDLDKDPKRDPSGKFYDWNLRVLTTWDGGRFVFDKKNVLVRYGSFNFEEIGRPLNVATGAQVTTLESFLRARNLSVDEQNRFSASLEAALKLAAEGLENRLDQDHGRLRHGKHLGYVGWDVIQHSEGRWFIPDVNAGPVGGGLAIESLLPLSERGKVILSPARYLAAQAGGYQKSISSETQTVDDASSPLPLPLDPFVLGSFGSRLVHEGFRDEGILFLKLSVGLKPKSVFVSLLEKNLSKSRSELRSLATNSHTVLKAVAFKMVELWKQTGYDIDFPIASTDQSVVLEDAEPSNLPFPDAPVVAVFSGSYLQLGAFLPALDLLTGVNLLVIPPSESLFRGNHNPDKIYLQEGVFVSRDGKLVQARFRKPVRVDAVVLGTTQPTETLRVLESVHIPTLDSNQALELFTDKSLFYRFLERNRFLKSSDFAILRRGSSLEDLSLTIRHFKESVGQDAGLVVFPSRSRQARGVRIFPSSLLSAQTDDAAKYAFDLLKEQTGALVKSEAVDKIHGNLRWHLRVFTSWDRDRPTLEKNSVLAVVDGPKPLIERPVHLALGSKSYSWKELVQLKNWDEGTAQKLWDGIKALINEVSVITREELNLGASKSFESLRPSIGFVAWDISLQPDGQWRIEDANLGPLAGLLNLEEKLPSGRKGLVLLPPFQMIVGQAESYRNSRASENFEDDELGVPLPEVDDPYVLANYAGALNLVHAYEESSALLNRAAVLDPKGPFTEHLRKVREIIFNAPKRSEVRSGSWSRKYGFFLAGFIFIFQSPSLQAQNSSLISGLPVQLQQIYQKPKSQLKGAEVMQLMSSKGVWESYLKKEKDKLDAVKSKREARKNANEGHASGASVRQAAALPPPVVADTHVAVKTESKSTESASAPADSGAKKGEVLQTQNAGAANSTAVKPAPASGKNEQSSKGSGSTDLSGSANPAASSPVATGTHDVSKTKPKSNEFTSASADLKIHESKSSAPEISAPEDSGKPKLSSDATSSANAPQPEKKSEPKSHVASARSTGTQADSVQVTTPKPESNTLAVKSKIHEPEPVTLTPKVAETPVNPFQPLESSAQRTSESATSAASGVSQTTSLFAEPDAKFSQIYTNFAHSVRLGDGPAGGYIFQSFSDGTVKRSVNGGFEIHQPQREADILDTIKRLELHYQQTGALGADSLTEYERLSRELKGTVLKISLGREVRDRSELDFAAAKSVNHFGKIYTSSGDIRTGEPLVEILASDQAAEEVVIPWKYLVNSEFDLQVNGRSTQRLGPVRVLTMDRSTQTALIRIPARLGSVGAANGERDFKIRVLEKNEPRTMVQDGEKVKITMGGKINYPVAHRERISLKAPQDGFYELGSQRVVKQGEKIASRRAPSTLIAGQPWADVLNLARTVAGQTEAFLQHVNLAQLGAEEISKLQASNLKLNQLLASEDQGSISAEADGIFIPDLKAAVLPTRHGSLIGEIYSNDILLGSATDSESMLMVPKSLPIKEGDAVQVETATGEKLKGSIIQIIDQIPVEKTSAPVFADSKAVVVRAHAPVQSGEIIEWPKDADPLEIWKILRSVRAAPSGDESSATAVSTAQRSRPRSEVRFSTFVFAAALGIFQEILPSGSEFQAVSLAKRRASLVRGLYQFDLAALTQHPRSLAAVNRVENLPARYYEGNILYLDGSLFRERELLERVNLLVRAPFHIQIIFSREDAAAFSQAKSILRGVQKGSLTLRFAKASSTDIIIREIGVQARNDKSSFAFVGRDRRTVRRLKNYVGNLIALEDEAGLPPADWMLEAFKSPAIFSLGIRNEQPWALDEVLPVLLQNLLSVATTGRAA